MFLKEFSPEDEQSQAKMEITEAKAILVLIENNDLACEIRIAGMKIGLCNNLWIKEAIENQISEIQKFLNGEENEWQ